MRISEICRLVYLNLIQNKFKVILTSIGIVVGSATIVLVIGIGTGSRAEVAEQFQNLNAGAIDISYEGSSSSSSSTTATVSIGGTTISFDMGGFSMDFGGGSGGGSGSRGSSEAVTLTTDDMEDLEVFVPGLSDATISYSTTASVEGGDLSSSSYYTVAGVLDNYAEISNLTMAIGSFLTEENNDNKEKVCVLGYTTAKEIFGSAADAYDETVYIDDRPYVVSGVLSEMGTVASGISPDTAIFIPYETGIKYITGTSISPTITVIAENVNDVDTIVENIETVLADSYPNSSFEISDAGSKMEAASSSNTTLTLLLYSMSAIVFVVGGIGIMNVLFVSVKERTNEIGILKALGCSRRDILLEFLLEASCISFIGAVIGVLFALALTPVVEMFSVRVDLSVTAVGLALVFGVATGSIFGFYPAYKASRLVPVVALNQE
ncbi:MAG: ABC transporter permease [Lachnospiraceae bacterium]|nr:ABC transporter permease [Lachnospiraceae bacterium]